MQLPSQDEKRNVEDKATLVISIFKSYYIEEFTYSFSKLSRDDAVMKASHDVTDSMKRTIALMQSELERSVLSSQLLGK